MPCWEAKAANPTQTVAVIANAMSNSPTDLAARIRAEHEARGAALKRGSRTTLLRPGMLIEAKAQLVHGERQVARPLRVLVPLIKDELAATDVIRQ